MLFNVHSVNENCVFSIYFFTLQRCQHLSCSSLLANIQLTFASIRRLILFRLFTQQPAAHYITKPLIHPTGFTAFLKILRIHYCICTAIYIFDLYYKASQIYSRDRPKFEISFFFFLSFEFPLASKAKLLPVEQPLREIIQASSPLILKS